MAYRIAGTVKTMQSEKDKRVITIAIDAEFISSYKNEKFAVFQPVKPSLTGIALAGSEISIELLSSGSYVFESFVVGRHYVMSFDNPPNDKVIGVAGDSITTVIED